MMRRTPLKQSAFVQTPDATCRICGVAFWRFNSTQAVCGLKCARRVGPALRREAASDRRSTRAALEALKTVPQLKKEAQAAFNAFIRARDRAAGYACICCDRPLAWDVKGGAVDAGHYRSTGSADHLRFNEANCHAQRSDCNRFGAGRAVDYRIGLIRRLGVDAVEALEANNEPVKWQRDELRATRDMYRRRARELNKT